MRLLLVMPLLWAGCAPVANDLETGTLEVSWTVGPDGCDVAGVTEVGVTLDGALMGSAPCEDGSTTLPRIEVGTRSMKLLGLDDEEVERYASDAEQVMILEGKTTVAEEQVLTALTGRVDVTWFFDNGRLCATNEVTDVVISVWEDGYLAAEKTAPCDDSEASVSGLPGGSYLLDLAALDDDGRTWFVGLGEIDLKKGDRQGVEVRLESAPTSTGGGTD